MFEDIEGVLPYIPNGYTQVEGTDLNTGFVIEDGLGNQYVWVEVPQTVDVYPTAGLNITQYTSSDYEKIEKDLQAYTSEFRVEGYTDTWFSEEATGLTQDEYKTQKKTMLKSIYKNGGFYVGRYETGTETARTSSNDSLTTPVIKQNVYPYNYVTNSQAQELSERFATEGYSTSLMFGVQWDLILKYMETKGATIAELNEDSTNWGNYANNEYTITNTSAKYNGYNSDTGLLEGWSWVTTYSKTSNNATILSTGSDSLFCKMGIYDLAGNAWEWTLEKTSNSSYPCVSRGGFWRNRR